MHKYYPCLFSPLKLGDKTAKNRIACAPQSVIGGEDAAGLTQRGFSYYLEKARGGCGIVTLGETQVLSDLFQRPNPDELTKYHLLTDLMRDYGALSSIELGHKGCEDYVFTPGAHVEGPSGGVKPDTGVIIDEIDETRMDELAEAYAQACQVCLDCGFDMVMVHGGHSWLLAQFLSPLFNKRTDQYGGSLENRARFPLMVLDRIRARVGRKLLIEYRMSADELIDGGVHIEEMVEFSKLLESRVDLIQASVGTHLDPWCPTFSSIYHKNGLNLPLAAAIRRAVRIPVAAIGGFNTPELCELALSSGQADVICMGRQLLADPHFAQKAELGEMEEIDTCIRCMGCHNAPVPPTYCTCTVNPTGGREFLLRSARQQKRRKVVVVGGGPAGMTAANRAAELGHEVVLLEKSGSLGGALKFAGRDAHKGDLRRFRDNLIARTLHRDMTEVRLNTEVSAGKLAALSPDLVVCAVGAERVTPPIPGLERAVHAIDAYQLDPATLGERVVIVGGGLVGCELAMHLSTLGKKLAVLELGPELAPDAYRMHRGWLMQRLIRVAACHPNTRCVEVTAAGAKAVDGEGRELFFPADTVIYALGLRARSELVEQLRAGAPRRFVAVGDCLRAAKLREAVHEGYYAVEMLD